MLRKKVVRDETFVDEKEGLSHRDLLDDRGGGACNGDFHPDRQR